MRVYELARDLGVDSKEVLAQAEELGLELKTASSGVDDESAELLRLAFAPEETAALGVQAVAETTADEGVEPRAGEVAVAEADAAEEVEVAEADGAELETEPESVPGSPSAAQGVETAAPVESSAPVESPASVETGAADVDIATVTKGTSVAEFAEAIGQAPGEVVKTLLELGIPVGVQQAMPEDMIDEVAERFGFMVEIVEEEPAPAVAAQPEFDDAEADLVPRPPVVTVMGHVDHGKTTLLDTIRKANVVEDEEGGITQHIGAYQVEVNDRLVTFVDTPGHEAFTALRARGANITDIVVLVVAADDGVMPQTIEAISHAKAAGVKMIVAVNKMDLPGGDPMRVRTELTNYGVVTEDLGGEIPTVEISALKGEGVDDLLEVIDLIAQLEDFRANPKPLASGVVVEAQLEVGRGPVATVIVKRGTLKQGDAFIAGPVSGRVRALMNDKGERVNSAGPSDPVQIMGWADVPAAGDFFEVQKNDKEARRIAEERQQEEQAQSLVAPSARDRLQGLLEQLRSDDAQLNLIVKADAQGSLEALRESIGKIEREGGKIQIIHTAVGGINENDVTLAEVTEAVIVGFNVRPEPKARRAAEEAGVEVRTYGIIYELLDEIEQLLVGQLAPDEEEVVLGTAEVRATFKVPRAGTIAGCYVIEGVVQRGAKARLLRDGVVIHDGIISSLKRFKDDVREVQSGFECGMGFESYDDIKDGDHIEVYVVREVART